MTRQKLKHQRLSRTLRTKRIKRIPPIDSIEHVRQLRGRDPNYAVRRRWPVEEAFLQPFGVERHAETVMPKDLDQVTSGASKDVKITCVGIAPQRFLDLQRQAIHAAPHIGSPDRKPNAHARGKGDHRRSRTSSTRRSACASTPLPTRTRYLPARSISIVSVTVDGAVATAAVSVVTVTGINCGADPPASARGSSR